MLLKHDVFWPAAAYIINFFAFMYLPRQVARPAKPPPPFQEGFFLTFINADDLLPFDEDVLAPGFLEQFGFVGVVGL